MNLLSDILRFRDALAYGYYNDAGKRAIFSITYDEAITFWHELNMSQEQEFLYIKRIVDPLAFEREKMRYPQQMPMPHPGRIWGSVYGIDVFVQGEPSATGEARRLLEYAQHLRMYGEYAPGGQENWHQWDRDVASYLRRGRG